MTVNHFLKTKIIEIEVRMWNLPEVRTNEFVSIENLLLVTVEN